MKKIKLWLIILTILTAIILIIGLTLISISHIHIIFFVKMGLIKTDGFNLIKSLSIEYILEHSANFIFLENNNYENYCNWIQLQVGIIFLLILVPFLLYIITLILITNIFLERKKKNKFWDAIENCGVINKYYIH